MGMATTNVLSKTHMLRSILKASVVACSWNDGTWDGPWQVMESPT
jgi:hypothetical protein